MSLPVRRQERDTSVERSDLWRWDPFAELDRLNRELTSYLESWRFPSLTRSVFTPAADVEETPEAYVIEIELPGVKRDDINIEITQRRITVDGERHEKERVGILRRRERTVGRFHYEIALPGELDEDRVEATLDHGVLTIKAPKPEQDRPRRIPIS